jgi:hypothetical protein
MANRKRITYWIFTGLSWHFHPADRRAVAGGRP